MNTPNDENDKHENEALAILLRFVETMRELIRKGRVVTPAHQKSVPRWDDHDARLDEIERLARDGVAKNFSQIDTLQQDFMLEFQADMTDSMRETSERIIRFTDDFARRVEEKKFEVDSETREKLEELVEPWHDGIREKMLGELPIETRRKLEEDQRRGEAE